MHRLTQPMRQVLSNLIEGKPAHAGTNGFHYSDRSSGISPVLTSLRKRGLVEQRSDASYVITPQGKAAIEAHRSGT